MEEKGQFELPKPWEKQSHKDILDSIKEVSLVEAESVLDEETPTEPPKPSQQTLGFDLPPGKKYFRIGEVSELIGVETHVLRYWENEFPGVRPVKSHSGHRVYARKDVETLYQIRHLLHEEKFSIQGAKQKLKERSHRTAVASEPSNPKFQQTLKELSHGLKELIRTIRTNPGEE